MYARQTPSSRFPNGIRIPSNYSGNAFRDTGRNAPPYEGSEVTAEEPLTEATDTVAGSTEHNKDSSQHSESLPVFNSGLGSLFKKGGGGIGLEELLILGLILLISQNDTKDDLAFLLMILLFIQ